VLAIVRDRASAHIVSAWHVGCKTLDRKELEETMKAVAVKSERKSGMFKVVKAPVSPETWTDLELVDQMVTGSALAWREFQRRYDRLVHRCILKVTRRFSSVVSQEDVREIAATLSLSLLANDMHKLRTFDPERGNRFSSWIGLLAINCAYDYLRQLRREPNKGGISEALDLVCDMPDPFELTSEHERHAIAQKTLEDFSEKDRTFAALYFGEGMTPEQVAEEMEISVKTVYSKKHKIRCRLEGVLSERRLTA